MSKVKRNLRFAWQATMHALDQFVDAAGDRVRIIRKEVDLFFGTALFFIGFLGFESDRYCDGNPVDYLSCTRPTTYYFYDNVDVILIVFGVFLILFWILKKRSERA